MEVIKTASLFKHFGGHAATNDISIHVSEGEVYGFLGLNGAGKTTLIRMLLGMIKPEKGEVFLFGQQLTPAFTRWNDIGYLVETPYAYPDLSVRENLEVHYKLRQLTDKTTISRIIEQLKLTQYTDKKAKHLSLGNQQRLGLAKALMHRPRLLILDEPINGLDPEGIVEVRELLRALALDGTTIFLSSHILGEISRIAHRIGIIHQGRLVKELTTAELSAQLVRQLIVDTTDNDAATLLLSAAGYLTHRNETGHITINDTKAIDQPQDISALLAAGQLPPRQVYLLTEDLEMYFLRTIKTA